MPKMYQRHFPLDPHIVRADAHQQQSAAQVDATRVPVTGRDEMTELGQAFKAMSGQLTVAAQKQHELKSLRRDLLAWAGHDLRTPLAWERAVVEALVDRVVDDPAERDRYLHTAQRDIGSLSGLIDNVFELAELDAGGFRLERWSVRSVTWFLTPWKASPPTRGNNR